jgi:hypothetical protein
MGNAARGGEILDIDIPDIDIPDGNVPGIDLATLADLATPPVLGGGRRVGEVRARPLTTI